MTSLVHRRCFHHAEREAVGRCPECGRFFCRECVSEHDDRILCTACLGKQAVAVAPRTGALGGISLLAQSVLAVTLIWFFFFLIGHSLITIPSAFHEEKGQSSEESR